MATNTQTQYLESKIKTASQPRLHLMLLDGALRFARQAQDVIEKEQFTPAAHGLLIRVSDIVEELTNGVASAKTDISKQLEEFYAFLYRELVAARIQEDLPKLNRCVELLTYQRETWHSVCEKLEKEPSHAKSAVPLVHQEIPAESFSLEA